MQRKERGSDDIQEGKPVNINDYLLKGWIRKGGEQEKINLLYGTLVTCLWLSDWKGARVYGQQLIKLNAPNFLLKIKMSLTVVRKLMARTRNNPYQHFTIPV